MSWTELDERILLNSAPAIIDDEGSASFLLAEVASWARRRFPDRTVVFWEEVASQTVLRVTENLGNPERAQPRSGLRQWVIGQYLNACRDVFEAERRSGIPIDNIGANTPSLRAGGEDSDPEGTAVRDEDREALRRCIKMLPDRQRKAIQLRYYEDFSSREIADSLGTSERAVNVLLHNARRRLAGCFAQQAAG